MYKIIEVLGMPPDHIINKASRAEKFFERSSMGTWILKRPRDSRKVTVMNNCVCICNGYVCYNGVMLHQLLNMGTEIMFNN